MRPCSFKTIIQDEMDHAFFLRGVLLLFVCGFVLRAWGLSRQQLSGDDIAVAISAMNYMERGHIGPTMWQHPVLRNILVYASLSLGGGVWALKINSLLLGSLSVPLLALVSRRIIRSGAVALLSAFFLMIDPLHIDFSRQAVHEVYMMFFSLLGILLSLSYRDGRKPALLFLAAVSFGLGIASKWYVAFPLVITALYLLYAANGERGADGNRNTVIALVIATFAAVPAGIYLLTYLPWFDRGYSLSDWIVLQSGMFREAVTHQGFIPYTLELSHKAYLWFLAPAAHPDFIYGAEGPGVLLGIGNPLVWLLALPSVAYLIVRAVKERSAEKYYLAGLFCLSYLPFLLTTRPLWAFTAFSIIPFAFVAIAYFLTDMARMRPGRRQALFAYLLIVVLVTIPLYILAIGKGLTMPLLKPLVETYRPSFER